jgi:hypothetical protein
MWILSSDESDIDTCRLSFGCVLWICTRLPTRRRLLNATQECLWRSYIRISTSSAAGSDAAIESSQGNPHTGDGTGQAQARGSAAGTSHWTIERGKRAWLQEHAWPSQLAQCTFRAAQAVQGVGRQKCPRAEAEAPVRNFRCDHSMDRCGKREAKVARSVRTGLAVEGRSTSAQTSYSQTTQRIPGCVVSFLL